MFRKKRFNLSRPGVMLFYASLFFSRIAELSSACVKLRSETGVPVKRFKVLLAFCPWGLESKVTVAQDIPCEQAHEYYIHIYIYKTKINAQAKSSKLL